MQDDTSPGFSVERLAHAAPVIRGLLATPTGNDDMPYRHVILKSLASQEAIDWAASPDKPGRPRPPAIQQLGTLPLYLDDQE
jgi:hypothetical protein